MTKSKCLITTRATLTTLPGMALSSGIHSSPPTGAGSFVPSHNCGLTLRCAPFCWSNWAAAVSSRSFLMKSWCVFTDLGVVGGVGGVFWLCRVKRVNCDRTKKWYESGEESGKQKKKKVGIINRRKLSNIPNLLRVKTNERCYLDNRGHGAGRWLFNTFVNSGSQQLTKMSILTN